MVFQILRQHENAELNLVMVALNLVNLISVAESIRVALTELAELEKSKIEYYSCVYQYVYIFF